MAFGSEGVPEMLRCVGAVNCFSVNKFFERLFAGILITEDEEH